MAADATQTPDSLEIDIGNLYREESFTELRAANIKRLTPVGSNGEVDISRASQYTGDTTLMTQMGPIPVQFALKADSLREAFEKFPQGVQDAIVQLQERAQEMAREDASRIVVPGSAPRPLAGGGPGGKLILD